MIETGKVHAAYDVIYSGSLLVKLDAVKNLIRITYNSTLFDQSFKAGLRRRYIVPIRALKSAVSEVNIVEVIERLLHFANSLVPILANLDIPNKRTFDL